MANENLGAAFSIDITSLKTGLAQANRLIRESQSEFKATAASLDEFSDAQELAEAKLKSLNTVQDLQRKKVDALQKEYDRLIADGMDPMSAAAVKLRTDINKEKEALGKTESEIKKQKSALEEMKNASEDAADGTKELEDSQDKAEKSVGKLDIAIGTLAGNLATKLVDSLGNAVSSMAGLAEETREYREDIGKLKTAWQSAGKTTEQATAIYKEFYSVLGEEDRSVEAVNHLAKFVDTEEDMAKWTDICAGVWGTFGDSLPIEGLTEASNETAKVGKLTGVLADALNWAGVNEDDFQASLDKCNGEQERAQLITKTLNGLYSDAAVLYKENNKSVIEARKANSDYTDSVAELGEAMEPLNTEISSFKNELVKGLTPAVKKEVIPALHDFSNELKQDGTVKKFSEGITNLSSKVLPPAAKAVKFCAENIDNLAGVTLGAITVYKTFTAVMAVSKTISATTTAVQGLTAGVGLATKAQTIWNAAMSANPIGAVLTAVGLLTAGVILLSQKLNDTEKSTDLLSESQRESVNAAKEEAEAFKETKQAADDLAAAELANIDYTKNLWSELQTLTDENGKVKEGYEARAGFILNELNSALGTEYTMNGNVINSYKDIKKSIEDVIATKKAQILLEAYEDSYREAVKKVADAEKARATQAQEIAAQEAVYNEAQKKYTDELVIYNERASKAKTEADWRALGSAALKLKGFKDNADKEKKLLDDKREDYNKTEKNLQGYYNTIDGYEMASSALLKGEVDKVSGYLNTYNGSFKTATDVVGKSKKEQVAILRQQVVDTEVNLRLLEADYKQKEGSMTEEQKKQAKTRIENARQQADSAKDEYAKVGGNMIEGMVKGVNEKDGSEKWSLTGALKKTVNKALKAAKDALGIKSPSKVFEQQIGWNIDYGMAKGITGKTDKVVGAIKGQLNTIENAYGLTSLSSGISNAVNSSVASGKSGSNYGTTKNVTVNQYNNYSKSHSRYEIFKSKQQTEAAVRLALGGA